MPKFIIDKIGPIEHVDFTLNKVNMLIGPQSSGKSTIAKVISFCLWLEKDVLMRRNTDYVSWSFVEKQLLYSLWVMLLIFVIQKICASLN